LGILPASSYPPDDKRHFLYHIMKADGGHIRSIETLRKIVGK
jgi:hypothetical protein